MVMYKLTLTFTRIIVSLIDLGKNILILQEVVCRLYFSSSDNVLCLDTNGMIHPAISFYNQDYFFLSYYHNYLITIN